MPRAREAKTAAPAEDIKGPLGRRIRELRERAGFSQGDLAHASGISKVFLGTLERGEKAATVESIEKLARGLVVEPLELFRFGARESSSDPAEKLGRRVVGLARGSAASKLARFERIARAFFEPDDDRAEVRRARRERAPPRVKHRRRR